MSDFNTNNNALTANKASQTDAKGNPSTSTTTALELSYVSGVSSSIQTQINGKQATGNYITALTGDITASGPGSVSASLAATTNSTLTTLSSLSLPASQVTGLSSLYLPLAGGTMSGALNMGGQNIYGNTTSSSDLILNSTSNATVGNIVIHDGSSLFVESDIGNLGESALGPYLTAFAATGALVYTQDAAYGTMLGASTGGGGVTFLAFSANGTFASPTYLNSGDPILTIYGTPWNTSYANTPANSPVLITMQASENHTALAQGCEIIFDVTPNGTTTTTQALHLYNDGTVFAFTGPFKASNLTASTVLTADSSKNIISSSVNTTTLGYLDATSSIQTQLNSKQTVGNSVTTPIIYNTAAQTTLTGSAGTAVCSQPEQGLSYKKVIVYLNGYTDTGTQTYTFPTAFINTPDYFIGATASPNVALVTVTSTTVTITSTLATGTITLIGY